MSTIPPISPVAATPASHADANTGTASSQGHAPHESGSSTPRHAAAGGGGFVDSVSLSANGEQVGGSVSVVGDIYVASVPGPPVEHATGSSPVEAASNLVRTVYRIT